MVCFGSCMDVAAIQSDMPTPLDFNRELMTVGEPDGQDGQGARGDWAGGGEVRLRPSCANPGTNQTLPADLPRRACFVGFGLSVGGCWLEELAVGAPVAAPCSSAVERQSLDRDLQRLLALLHPKACCSVVQWSHTGSRATPPPFPFPAPPPPRRVQHGDWCRGRGLHRLLHLQPDCLHDAPGNRNRRFLGRVRRFFFMVEGLAKRPGAQAEQRPGEGAG